MFGSTPIFINQFFNYKQTLSCICLKNSLNHAICRTYADSSQNDHTSTRPAGFDRVRSFSCPKCSNGTGKKKGTYTNFGFQHRTHPCMEACVFAYPLVQIADEEHSPAVGDRGDGCEALNL
jgi:hypothetical protein